VVAMVVVADEKKQKTIAFCSCYNKHIVITVFLILSDLSSNNNNKTRATRKKSKQPIKDTPGKYHHHRAALSK
jgi:hypothetical protein